MSTIASQITKPHVCLLNRLFGRRSKKTSKLRVTGLCARNSPGTGEFPAQRASNAENVSIWWRHHCLHPPHQHPLPPPVDFYLTAPQELPLTRSRSLPANSWNDNDIIVHFLSIDSSYLGTDSASETRRYIYNDLSHWLRSFSRENLNSNLFIVFCCRHPLKSRSKSNRSEEKIPCKTMILWHYISVMVFSSHQQIDCFFYTLTSKQLRNIKAPHYWLCVRRINPLVTGGFPFQRAWRLHESDKRLC